MLGGQLLGARQIRVGDGQQRAIAKPLGPLVADQAAPDDADSRYHVWPLSFGTMRRNV
jgi:hypothetical protein